MRSRVKIKILFLPLFISLFLVGAVAAGQGDEEREKLLEQQKQLGNRIETLERERDLLLFQKTLYASDSKYLIINITARTGQLKYKNRVLKDFRLLSASGPIGRLRQGTITLTKKIEGAGERHALVFGKSLMLQGRRSPMAPPAANVPRITLAKKDLRSIFYAVEEGTRTYILP